MKAITLIGMASVIITGIGRCEPVHKNIETVIAALIPKGWSLSTDGSTIVCSASDIKVLNPISLPASYSEDSLWNEFSRNSDFNVVVRITPKINQIEYASLVKMRSDFLERRVSEFEKKYGEKINGKSLFGFQQEVLSIVSLPYCYSETKSIWITTTDSGLLLTRPKSARDFSDALKKALSAEFTLHDKDR